MNEQWTPVVEPSGRPTYLAIVKSLERDIHTGSLVPGMRLPPQRNLADTLGIALGTVTRAYNEAIRRGLIRSGGRLGTFVGHPDSAPTDFCSHSCQDTTEETIDLARNYAAILDDPDLSTVFQQLSAYPYSQYLLRYTGAEGYNRHRKAGSKWIALLGLDVDPDRLLPSCGAQQALAAILPTIAKPGDTIAADQLTYPGIKSLCALYGLNLIGIGSDREGVIPEHFAQAAEQHEIKALYLVPTLNNPTNSILPPGRRREIVEIAQSRDILIIEDDIYRALIPSPPPLFAELAPDRTFLVASISKIISAGLRVAYIAPPAAYLSALRNTLYTMSLNVSPIPLEVFSRWMDDGIVPQIIDARRRDAATRQALALEYLGDAGMVDGPLGYTIWLPLPDYWTASSFTAAAQQQGVLVCGSDCFAVDDTPPVEAVRICLSAAADLDKLRTALAILAELLRQPPCPQDFAI